MSYFSFLKIKNITSEKQLGDRIGLKDVGVRYNLTKIRPCADYAIIIILIILHTFTLFLFIYLFIFEKEPCNFI